MKIIFILGSIIVPLVMWGLRSKWARLGLIFNLLATLAALIFGNISAFAVYDILRNKTVFMTNIHAIFLNPFFLLTGAYLGVYLLYTLVFYTFKKNE